jgi:hypothetical protein
MLVRTGSNKSEVFCRGGGLNFKNVGPTVFVNVFNYESVQPTVLKIPLLMSEVPL